MKMNDDDNDDGGDDDDACDIFNWYSHLSADIKNNNKKRISIFNNQTEMTK